MVTRLMGGRTHPSQITIRNTSGRPAIFRITVTPGFAQAFGGFVQEDPGTPVDTGLLRDGDEQTLRVFFRLPGRSPAGPKAFQVRVEEIDEAGRSRGLALTPQTFAGLAEIEEEIAIDLGAPVGPPALIPTAADLAFDFRDLLQTPALTLAPAEVTKPRPSRGTVTIPLSTPLPFAQPFRATVNIFLTQPGFQRRVSSTTLTVPRGGQELHQLFTVETTGLAPGAYNFRIEITDPASNQLLQGFDLPQPILTVLGLAVPVPAVPREDIDEELELGAPEAPRAAAVPLTEEQLLQGLTLGPVEVVLPPVVVASRVPPGTPVTLSLPFRFPTPRLGTSLPEMIQPLRALAFLRGPLQQTTVQLLDTANFIIRPGQSNRLSAFTLPRNAESGPYTIQVFVVNPFDPIGPGGRANYLPGFGPGNFPAGFTVQPLPTAPRVFDIDEELRAPTQPRVFDIEDEGDFGAPAPRAAPAPTPVPVTPTPIPVMGVITPVSQIANRVQLGQIALAGTRITADPAGLRRGQRTTLNFSYNNISPVEGPTNVSLRVIDRDGRIASQVPRFRATIRLRQGFGAFQVPFTAPTILPNGLYGIELTLDRPEQADPTGPTPVLQETVPAVFQIR